jgi:oligopeptide transport system substrate-binding protein
MAQIGWVVGEGTRFARQRLISRIATKYAKEESMTQSRRGWAIAVALVILGLVATACQQGTPGTSPGTSGATGQADPNGIFVENLGGSSDPDTIDPQKESFVSEINVTMKVFDPLMTFDDKGNAAPLSVTGMPKLSSDGLTYTFTLKDGLQYSDGQPVTAKNYEYAFKRLCDPNVAGDYAFTGYIVAGCEKYSTADPKATAPADLQKLRDAVQVKANGDKEISYTLTDKAPYFLAIMATWVGVPTREDMVTKGGEKWATDPSTFIGNGPWVMTEWKHNESITFTRNDKHNPQVKFKTWKLVMINEHAVEFTAYRSDELDTVSVIGSDRKTVEGDADLSKQLTKGATSPYCTFTQGYNTTKPPFDDPNVRLAFSKAIDRQQYVEDILGGIGSPNMSFMPPGLPAYDPTDDTQKFDATAAKQLLSQSKYAADLTSGKLKVSMGFSSSQVGLTRAQWFQGQYKQNLGVTIDLDAQESTTYSKNVKKVETTPQIFRLGWCMDYPDPQDWLTTVFRSDTTVWHGGWKNQSFDDLVTKADSEPDQAKREQEYKDAQKILTKDAPVGFVYTNAAWTLVKPWVQGWKLSALDYYFSSLNVYNMTITTAKPKK